jgi:hypothetical protein
MKRYKSRPATIRAMTYAEGLAHAHKGDDPHILFSPGAAGTKFLVQTIGNSWVEVREGDFVIAEPDGQGYYPCDPDVFHRRWELELPL